MRTVTLTLGLLVVSGCADSCGCDSREPPAATAPAPGEPAAPSLPKPAPTAQLPTRPGVAVIKWDALAAFTPDNFAGYAAAGAPDGKIIELPNGMQLSTVKRNYTVEASVLELELIDTAQAPNIRQMFVHAGDMARSNEESVVKPVTVQGNKAIAQWHKSLGTARLGVLVKDRFIVNVNLKPANSIDGVLALAEKVDFAGVAALEPAAAPTPSTPVPAAKTTAPATH